LAKRAPRSPRRFQRLVKKKSFWAAFGLACMAGAITHATVGCEGWDPTDPFKHNSPEVEQALAAIDAGDLRSANEVLTDYLGTGVCDKGKIGIPDSVRQKPDGSFDLGIVLFYMGEKYGRKFGDEEKGDPNQPDNPEEMKRRSDEIDCAQLIIQSIAADHAVPLELRARAYYLAGNLEFMRRRYEDAVRYYDQALRLIPGVIEEAGGDGIGRDTAWNRAIALRRIEDEKNDAGADGSDGNDGDDGADGDGNDGDDAGDADADGAPDAPDGDAGGGDSGDSGDSGDDAGDSGQAQSGDAGDDGGEDAGPDGSPQDSQPDAGEPDGGDQSPQQPDPNQPPNSPSRPDDDGQSQELQEDEQLLDEFDRGTPTYQQEEAKRRGGQRRTMEDK
jgi:hypothetical protein